MPSGWFPGTCGRERKPNQAKKESDRNSIEEMGIDRYGLCFARVYLCMGWMSRSYSHDDQGFFFVSPSLSSLLGVGVVLISICTYTTLD